MSQTQPQFGFLLREWRQHRRVTQLDLALDASISTRHISFLETGRARPSREMVLRLAEQLRIPIRARNVLLIAAGFAPAYGERDLSDPNLTLAREAVDMVINGHSPYPAIAVDRHWTLVCANDAVNLLLTDVAPALLRPPVNVIRLALHPDGLAPRIVNLASWREHLLERLHRQIEVSADPVLRDLLAECLTYPAPEAAKSNAGLPDTQAMVMPLRLMTELGILNFFSTVTVFGTPLDVTLSELAIEAFYPVDTATREVLRRAAELQRAGS